MQTPAEGHRSTSEVREAHFTPASETRPTMVSRQTPVDQLTELSLVNATSSSTLANASPVTVSAAP
jgi:hypothetical protein